MRDRGHRNSNERGSTTQRRVRRQWLLDTFGDGTVAKCWETDCTTMVTSETIYCDRIIPRHEGGTYAQDNIRVHCQYHSCLQGARMRAELRQPGCDKVLV